MLASQGTKTITIKPNVEWSIELSNKTDFYIKDGNNEVYTMHGEAGEFSITVCAREIVDFDEDHTCDVTMTMQNEVKTIAKFTVNKIARVLTVYAAKVEEGQFVKNEEGAYVYETTAANNVTLLYDNQEYKYLAPVKVVSNFSFNVVGPEWMSPAEGGDANNEVELVFTADANKLPSDDATADVKFVDANKEDKVGATIKVVMEGSSKFMEYFFVKDAALFNYEGRLLNSFSEDNTIAGSIKANSDAEVVAVAADGSDASWVTIAMGEWDNEGASIQERSVNVGVTANEGESVRKAYVLALPASMAVENVADLVADGSVKEEYATYLALTVTQYSTPATISHNNNFFEPAYMADADATAWPFNELSDYYIGSAYEVLYVCEYDNEDVSYKATKDIKSFRSFACTDNGLKDITGENAWVKANKESVEAGSWFKITMDPTASTSDISWNPVTKDLEAVLLVEYTDGTCSAFYCRYNENPAGGSSDGGPEFAYPDFVWQDGTSLVELTEGEWYNVFAEFGVPVYQLTYTSSAPSMSMFKNLPQFCTNVMESDWLAYEYGEEFQMITMAESGNGQVGALYFQDGATGAGKYIIVCTLQLGE